MMEGFDDIACILVIFSKQSRLESIECLNLLIAISSLLLHPRLASTLLPQPLLSTELDDITKAHRLLLGSGRWIIGEQSLPDAAKRRIVLLAELSEGVLLGWFLELCVVLGKVFGEVSKSDLFMRVGWLGYDSTSGNCGIGGWLWFGLVGDGLFYAVPYWIQVTFVLGESGCKHYQRIYQQKYQQKTPYCPPTHGYTPSIHKVYSANFRGHLLLYLKKFNKLHQKSPLHIDHPLFLLPSTPTTFIFILPYSQIINSIYNFSMITSKTLQTDSHVLLKAKSPPPRLQNYQEKLQSALQLNGKLKELLQAIRNNTLSRKAEQTQASQSTADDQHILRLRRKQQKLTSSLQQLTNNLNVLIAENGKLKAQVDTSRNSRVIYSNVYKTIEKEIRKHEYLYKLAIVDYLCYEEVEKRAKDRVGKTAKRIQKDIGELQGSNKPHKKEKRKSRLDTGLSHRMESKDTYRLSNDDRTARQNPSLRETALSKREQEIFKRDPIQRMSTDKIDPTPILPPQKKEEEERHERTARSKGQIVTQQGQDYYQLEMRSNYYDNLIKHLKEITGLEDLSQIITQWQQADKQVEREYAEYLQLQRQAKAIRQERQTLERELCRSFQKEIGTDGSEEEQQLAAVSAEIEAERHRLTQLQEKLTGIIDINSSRLTDEEIDQHVQRIKRRGDATARELEKLLESVSKEKTASVTASRITNKSRIS